MQEITTSNSKKVNPVLDFDLDDFDFKPVTKGLGFHHEKEKAKKTNPQLRTPRPAVSRRIQTKPETQKLSAPYKEVELDLNIIKKQDATKTKKVTQQKARMGLQFTAFVFDLIIILAVQGLMNFLFLKVVELDSITRFIEFTWIEQSLFFSFLFLFYFTLLDVVASPGKKIFSIRLISTVRDKVAIDQTLVRSVVTLFSFITVGMPLFFDFQGKLSDTKAIEDV